MNGLKSIKISAMVLLFLSFICNNALAQTGQLPRLWKATKPGEGGRNRPTIYILAITHYGLPVEFDQYLSDKILPALRSSDVLLFEGAGGASDEPKPTCDDSSLDDEAKEKLHVAREKFFDLLVAAQKIMLRQAIENGSESNRKLNYDSIINISRSMANTYDEPTLIEEIPKYLSVIKDSEEVASNVGKLENETLRGSVVTTLMMSKPGIITKDVDSKYAFRKAYCASGSHRVDILLNKFEMKSMSQVSPKIPQLQQDFSTLLSKHVLSPQSDSEQLTAIDKALVCDRNLAWKDSINRIFDKHTYFYAIGAKHLFSTHNKDATCDGLLSDMAKSGWRVSLIQ